MAVAGDLKPHDAASRIEEALSEIGAAAFLESRSALNAHLKNGDFYKAMRLIGGLIGKTTPFEAASDDETSDQVQRAAP
jgi:hypothetical protein